MSQLVAGLGWSLQPDTAAAVAEALGAARPALAGRAPSAVFVTTTVEHDAQRVSAALAEQLPGVPVHGITTSLGVLGARGVLSGPGGAVGVLLVHGAGGVRIAAAAAPLRGDARTAATAAAADLLSQSGGELPRVVLFNASPGDEEALLEALGEALPDVPMFGGSAADHAIAGEWSVFTSSGPYKDAVSLLGFFGPLAVGGAIRAPYEPTGQRGTITGSEGRTLRQLDGRPAGAVLNEWLGGEIAEQLQEGGNILAQTALRPVGIRHATPGGEHWLTIHPAHVDAKDQSVALFARAEPQESLCVMRGSVSGLIEILGDLYTESLLRAGLTADAVRLGVLIYCAGCAGAVGPELDAGLRAQLAARIGDVPLLGMCTFGEQGHVPGVGNFHQDLSVSLVLIGERSGV